MQSHFLCYNPEVRAGLIFSLVLLWTSQARADQPSGVSAQSITLPSGPTSLKGLGESFSPDIATGTGSYSIPIDVPPGFVKPGVALSYNTGSGKGELGLGFSLPKFFIYRTTDKGLPHYNEEDRFAVSGGFNDELVQVNRQLRYYRLKNEGAFALFIRDEATDSWRIRDPGGDTFHLGSSFAGRQQNAYGTFRWYLERREDRFGHWTEYDYTTNRGHVYASQIRYQLHAATAYQNTIEFVYDARPDTYTDYTYGEADTVALRLARIDVLHGTRLLRTYELGYHDEALFSTLAQVTMLGEVGKPCGAQARCEMPPVTLTYVPAGGDGELAHMSNVPPGLIPAEGERPRYTLEDVNGDGLTDVLTSRQEDGQINYFYYANVDGLEWSERLPVPNPPDRLLSDEGVVVTDVDGDGFRDVLHSTADGFRYYPSLKAQDGVFLGFGDAIDLNDGGSLEVDWSDPSIKLTDLNRDGRTDVLHQIGVGNPRPMQSILNISSGGGGGGGDRLQFDQESLPASPAEVLFEDPLLVFDDFNGDGHLDFIKKPLAGAARQLRVWFGLGGGRYSPRYTVTGVPDLQPDELYLVDINRDGQSDLVTISARQVRYYLNNGRLQLDGPHGSYNGLPSTFEALIQLADMNGNGTTDVVYIGRDGSLKYLELMSEPFSGLLTGIDNGMGAVTTLTYRSSTEYMIDAQRAELPWATPLRTPIPLLAEMSTTDSLDKLGAPAQVSRITYVYRDGYYDGREREFRGFGKVTTLTHGDAHQPTAVTETSLHVGINLVTGADEEVLKGQEYFNVLRDLDGVIFATTETLWQRRHLCQEELGTAVQVLPRCADFPDRQAAKDSLIETAERRGVLKGAFEGTSDPRWTYTEVDLNIWGQEITTRHFGEVTFALPRAVGNPVTLAAMNVAVGNDQVVAEQEFLNDTEQWFIGLSKVVRLRDSTGAILSQSQTYFDGLPLGQVLRGKMSKQSSWLRDATSERWVDTLMSTDAAGQVTATEDAIGGKHEYLYDVTGFFLQTERVHVDGRLYDTQVENDRASGQVVAATTVDGSAYRYSFDGLQHLTQLIGPQDSPSRPEQRFSYAYGTSEHPISHTLVEVLTDRERGLYAEAHQFTDGLGRQRLKKVPDDSGGGFLASGWQTFTSAAQAAREYPQFVSTHAGFDTPAAAAPHTEHHYDVAGRPVRRYTPKVAGAPRYYTSTVFAPFEVSVFDERDSAENTSRFPASSRIDGLGRIVQLERWHEVGGAPRRLLWNISYDARNNITAIEDPGGSSRGYTYDSLNSLIGVDDPHAGSIRYTRDAVGNPLVRVDALGQSMRWTYDSSSRVLSHRLLAANGEVQANSEYHYDTPHDSTLSDARFTYGRLAWLSHPLGTSHFSYDSEGRIERVAESLWNPWRSSFAHQERDTFVQIRTLDAMGRTLETTGPGNFSLQYTYDRTSKVVSVHSGGHPVIASIDYHPSGMASAYHYGNGVTSCAFYSVAYQLIGLRTAPTTPSACQNVSPGTSFQDERYDLGPDGLLTAIHDLAAAPAAALSAAFVYDRLGQLLEVAYPQGSVAYGYDDVQNLVSQQSTLPDASTLPTGTFRYGENGHGPNSLTGYANEELSYDAAGQLQAFNGFALSYDAAGRLVRATRSAGEDIQYYYDNAGERRVVVVTSPGAATRIQRTIMGAYEEIDAERRWQVSVGDSLRAEYVETEGLVPTLSLLYEIVDAHAQGAGSYPAPTALLDVTADGHIDRRDLARLLSAYWREASNHEASYWLYHHPDRQNSATLITDDEGQPVIAQAFLPYGTPQRASGLSARSGFAGAAAELVAELGLVRFGARYYAPALGRWISVDPLLVESPEDVVENPLEANIYAYVLNNPLSFSDPSGLKPEALDVVGVLIDGAEATLKAEWKPLAEAGLDASAQAGWVKAVPIVGYAVDGVQALTAVADGSRPWVTGVNSRALAVAEVAAGTGAGMATGALAAGAAGVGGAAGFVIPLLIAFEVQGTVKAGFDSARFFWVAFTGTQEEAVAFAEGMEKKAQGAGYSLTAMALGHSRLSDVAGDAAYYSVQGVKRGHGAAVDATADAFLATDRAVRGGLRYAGQQVDAAGERLRSGARYTVDRAAAARDATVARATEAKRDFDRGLVGLAQAADDWWSK